MRRELPTCGTVLRKLGRLLDDDAAVCVDVGQNQIWAAKHLPMKHGRFLTTGGLGTMGYALPAAVGPLLWNHDAVLLANHGVLTVGADLEQAYWRMETVEHTAQIHLNARLLGGGVALSAQEVEELQK